MSRRSQALDAIGEAGYPEANLRRSAGGYFTTIGIGRPSTRFVTALINAALRAATDGTAMVPAGNTTHRGWRDFDRTPLLLGVVDRGGSLASWPAPCDIGHACKLGRNDEHLHLFLPLVPVAAVPGSDAAWVQWDGHGGPVFQVAAAEAAFGQTNARRLLQGAVVVGCGCSV